MKPTGANIVEEDVIMWERWAGGRQRKEEHLLL